MAQPRCQYLHRVQAQFFKLREYLAQNRTLRQSKFRKSRRFLTIDEHGGESWKGMYTSWKVKFYARIYSWYAL